VDISDLLLRPMKDPNQAQQQSMLHRATALFARCGIKAVTMDDVSKDLAISKKTLYQFFKNKGDLVQQSVSMAFSQRMKEVTSIQAKHDNAVDELVALQAHMIQTLQKHTPTMLFALEKYHRKTYLWLVEKRKAFMLDFIASNLKRGIQQGLYQNHGDIQDIPYLRYSQIIGMMEDETLMEDPQRRNALMQSGLDLYLRAIATPQGLSYYREHSQSTTANPETIKPLS